MTAGLCYNFRHNENESKRRVTVLRKNATVRRGFFHSLWKYRVLTLMALPAVAFVFVFSYLPLPGIVLAFKNYTYDKGIFGSDWAGLNNFKFFFVSGAAARVTVNTVLYNVAFTAVGMFLQLTTAILLSELSGRWFKKITQSINLLPFFISWVVVGAIVFGAFNYEFGAFNSLRAALGLSRVDVLNKAEYWPFILVAMNAWKGFGYGSVVYLSAITGIDQEIYEAAEIDGASILRRIFSVTLPNLVPTVILLLLLGLGGIIRGDFGMFYNLTGNNPLLYDVTDIVDTFVYRSLMTSNNIGMSTAAGVYQSAIGFVIVMTVNGIIRRVQPEYSLF